MEYRELPGTGRRVSRIAFGGAAMGGHDYGPVDDAESTAAVHAALDAGITLFETADVYGLGRAEEVLGCALAGRRDLAVIATKGGVRWDASGRTTRTLDPGYLVGALEASLRRLKTGHVELYQVHWPVPGQAIEPAFEALQRCREMGKCLAVGVCNFDGPAVDRAAGRGALASEQLGFNLVDQSARPRLEAAAAAGRLTMTYNSLAQGLFAGRHRATERFSGSDLRTRYGYFAGERRPEYLAAVERLHAVADARGRTPLQVAVRWALDRPFVGVAITGIKHPWQARENAGAADWTLSEAERRFLEGAAVADTA